MSRIIACPGPDDLLRVELGESSVNQSGTLQAHVAGCAACGAARAGLRRMMDDLAAPAGPAGDTEAFVARVEAAARAQPRPLARAQAARPSWWRGPRVVARAAMAAALVSLPLALMIGLRSRDGRDSAAPGVVGTFAARGHAADANRIGAEVLLLRDGRLQPLARQTVCGTEGFAVRVTNLSGRATHIMAFARDAAGGVHWLYPGYLDARTNPPSVSIADGTKDRLLDEIVQPDAPAPGPMRIVTLLSPHLLNVKEVEARLAAADPETAIPGLFPEAVAREWIAPCVVRR